MAIQFNLNALSRFSNVNFGDNDAIANLDGGNGLVQNEKLGFILTRKFRSSTAEKQNNAVRTEFLKALGNAFGLNEGIVVNNGKTTFTDQFMNRLEEILGPAFKRGDFGIKNAKLEGIDAAALEELVNLSETWRRLLADFRPIAKAAAERTEGAPQFGDNGFVQV